MFMNLCLSAAVLPLICVFGCEVKHWVKHIAPKGKRIEIEDHSIWLIAPHSRHIANSWAANDELEISPNQDPLSAESFPFEIKNITQNLAPVIAVLQLGPEKDSAYACWINEIDRREGFVNVSHGEHEYTRWRIEPKDYQRCTDWQPEQGVVIGKNSGLFSWWYSSHKHVLINVNRAEWIRVKHMEN